jgi:hypothetical protein
MKHPFEFQQFIIFSLMLPAGVGMSFITFHWQMTEMSGSWPRIFIVTTEKLDWFDILLAFRLMSLELSNLTAISDLSLMNGKYVVVYEQIRLMMN